MTPAQELARIVCRLLAPPPELRMSEWADRFFRLSPEYAAKPGQWTCLPYQREPMNAVSDPRVRRVVIKSATQMLKSVVIQVAIGYFADVDPGPMLLIQPGDKDAKDFSKERVATMIRDTPRLKGIFRESKRASSDGTITEKLFPGGMLAITGGGSPRNVARRTIRFLFCDEIDKYKPTAEGNVIALARKRQAWFLHRAKELDTCSPTVANSEIDRAYLESDQRQYFVPCPFCGFTQSLMGKFFKQVRWDSTLPTREEQAKSARYYCEACKAPWGDAARWKAVDNGQWRALAPFAGTAGFWISELYSYQRQLWEIVMDFLAKKDDAEDYRTFINTTLAENWTEPGEALDWERISERREDYPVGRVPEGALFLTSSVDVQRADGGRLEVRVNSYGENRERWAVDYRIFPGDPTDTTGPNSPWRHVEAMLNETWPTPGGFELSIERMFVDSGDGTVTPSVYDWVKRQPRPRVWAIKGDKRSDQPVGPPRAVELTVAGKKRKYGVCFKIVNSDFFKAQFYADLKKRPPTPDERKAGMGYPQGYIHIPKDTIFGDEHCRQLCSEELRTKRNKQGRAVTVWVQTQPHNEALDTQLYCDAAAWDYGAHKFQRRHWDLLRAKVGSPPSTVPEPASLVKRAAETASAPLPPPPPREPREGGWMGGRSRGWFSRR